MKKLYNLFLLFGSLCLLASCHSNAPVTADDWFAYINDPSNGLVKVREVNGFRFEMKYLPADYWVYREATRRKEKLSEEERESIRQVYEGSHHFLLSIGTDGEKRQEVDIMRVGVNDYKDYSFRMHKMNFTMKESFSLKGKRHQHVPTFANLENVYGLSPKRNLNLVFLDNEDIREASTWDIKMEDDIFHTGIHHFSFNRTQLHTIPTLTF